MKFYETIEKIEKNETYKDILQKSFGGILYVEGTQKDYNSKEILKLWNQLNEAEKEATGGIMKGVFNFLLS